MIKMSDKNYEEISSTAIVTSYPRTFTDIEYEKQIYNWLDKNYPNQYVKLDKFLAPEIEARYKLINKLLDKTKITQILELAAGYTSRGLIYANKGYKYIEMDLEVVTNNKKNIIKDICSTKPNNLEIISGNALNYKDYQQIDKFLEKEKPLAIINEGLLRYLSFEEKKKLGENIYNVLKKYGGVWITSDVTPKKFIESQNQALPDFNKNLAQITKRNNINDRFDDIEHVKDFFGKIGFVVEEIHPFSEVKKSLYSMNKNNIKNDNIEKYLEDAIVVIMKIKEDKKLY